MEILLFFFGLLYNIPRAFAFTVLMPLVAILEMLGM